MKHFQPYAEQHDQKYISKAHIDRNYQVGDDRDQRSHNEHDQDIANTIYQSYYEFKPSQGSDSEKQAVGNGSRKHYLSSSETSPVFKKPCGQGASLRTARG